MLTKRPSVSPNSQGANTFALKKDAKSKRVTYDEKEFELKVGGKHKPNSNQVY